jgi:hypothetical protein
MEDDIKKSGRRTQTQNKKDDRRPQKNGRQPQAQFKKSTLNGCDILVNEPSVG